MTWAYFESEEQVQLHLGCLTCHFLAIWYNPGDEQPDELKGYERRKSVAILAGSKTLGRHPEAGFPYEIGSLVFYSRPELEGPEVPETPSGNKKLVSGLLWKTWIVQDLDPRDKTVPWPVLAHALELFGLPVASSEPRLCKKDEKARLLSKMEELKARMADLEPRKGRAKRSKPGQLPEFDPEDQTVLTMGAQTLQFAKVTG